MAVGQQGGPCLLALDSTYVYWADVALTDAGTGPASFSISRSSQATPGTVTPAVPTTTGSDADKPDPIPEQLQWLEAAGLSARRTWKDHQYAVIVAEKPGAAVR